jgi:hypothetical protein
VPHHPRAAQGTWLVRLIDLPQSCRKGHASPSQDTPDILDTLIAASLQSHREKLLRRVRNQKIRMRIALGLSGSIALFALAAYLIGDYAAARFCAMNACIVFAFTCIVAGAARKNAANALREIDRPA